MKRVLILLSVALPLFLSAQERPPASQKPVPESRPVVPTSPVDDVKGPSTAEQDRQEQGTLPKIDLPEFVITGIVSIDLPEVEKEGPDEQLDRIVLVFKNPIAENRDRETVELTVNEKSGFAGSLDESFFGKVLASMGTYRTPRLALWFGRDMDEYRYIVEGGYRLTEGYAPFTKRTEGSFGLKGGIRLNSSSSLLNRGMAGGFASYTSETFRFHGSRTPDATRTISLGTVGVSLGNNSPWTPVGYDLSVAFRNLSVTDSTSLTTENKLNISLSTSIPAGSAKILGNVQYSTIWIGGGSYPFGEASIGSSILWWGKMFIQPSAHVYLAKGMANQKLARVYPHLLVGVRISDRTTLSALYRGSIQATTLGAGVHSFPYLSTTTLLRQADVPLDVLALLDTDWDEVWRSRFSVNYQSMKGHPLYTELLAAPGIGRFFYSGTTTLAAYRTDVFAKFSANGYFAFGLAVHSTKNSVTQGKIPYVSDFEISSSYHHTFPFGLTVAPRLQFVDRRPVDVVSGARLPEYWLAGLRMEYSVRQPLDVFLDLDNVNNRNYEVWRGYRAAPFMMHAGISYRW